MPQNPLSTPNVYVTAIAGEVIHEDGTPYLYLKLSCIAALGHQNNITLTCTQADPATKRVFRSKQREDGEEFTLKLKPWALGDVTQHRELIVKLENGPLNKLETMINTAHVDRGDS